MTLGKLLNLRDTVNKDDRRSSSSYRIIARFALSTFFEEQLYTISFTKLREKFLTSGLNSKHDPVPEDEINFYKFVCKTILEIDKEPVSVRSELFTEVTRDLHDINNKIDETIKKIKVLKNKEPLSDEQKLESELLEHFLSQLTDAKKEITDFIGDKHKIHWCIIERTEDKSTLFGNLRKLTLLFIPGNSQYSTYPYNKRTYTFKIPNSLDNKPFNISFKKYQKLKADFSLNPAKCKRGILSLINELDPTTQSKLLIKKSLVLINRKKQLLEIIQLYQEGYHHAFITSALIQAEGIFEDICRAIAPTAKVSERGTLSPKVKFVLEKSKLIDSSIRAEYYLFYLKYLRNKIAHAKPIDFDEELLAGLLLIDLYELLRISSSNEIPLNKKIDLLSKVSSKSKKNSKLYAILFILQLYNDVSVKEHKKYHQIEVKSEQLLIDPEFWNFIDGLLNRERQLEIVNYYVKKVLIHLKGKAELETECTSRISKIPKQSQWLIDKYSKADIENLIHELAEEITV